MRQRLAAFLCGAARPVYGGAGCILCFHRVVADGGFSSIAENRAIKVGADDLRWILEWTRARGLDAISMDAVPARLENPRGNKFVCFTFDDGYRDNLRAALPLFREFRAPFTVHVATRLADATAPLWWFALEQVVNGRAEFAFEWAGKKRAFSLDTEGQREAAFVEMARLIREQGRDTRDEVVACICREAGVDPLEHTRALIMRWDELRELAADPLVTIGTHTAGHHTLNRLTDDEARDELLGAKREIESRLGREVKHLAYPFGGRNAVGPREFALAAECGFATAVTTRCANLFPAHARHLHALPRLTVSGNYDIRTLLPRLESGLLPARTFAGRRVVTD
jgi:peptidoglycan/xylan/chitin deacetylase (PgdA/CDA1 family)